MVRVKVTALQLLSQTRSVLLLLVVLLVEKQDSVVAQLRVRAALLVWVRADLLVLVRAALLVVVMLLENPPDLPSGGVLRFPHWYGLPSV